MYAIEMSIIKCEKVILHKTLTSCVIGSLENYIIE